MRNPQIFQTFQTLFFIFKDMISSILASKEHDSDTHISKLMPVFNCDIQFDPQCFIMYLCPKFFGPLRRGPQARVNDSWRRLNLHYNRFIKHYHTSYFMSWDQFQQFFICGSTPCSAHSYFLFIRLEELVNKDRFYDLPFLWDLQSNS